MSKPKVRAKVVSCERSARAASVGRRAARYEFSFLTLKEHAQATYVWDGRKHVLCLPASTGCFYDCLFCSSRLSGAFLGLGFREIVGVALEVARAEGLLDRRNLLLEGERERTLVSFMGPGEPSSCCGDLEAVVRSLSARGFSRFAASTSGRNEGAIEKFYSILRLGADPAPKLQLSLHAVLPETRRLLFPTASSSPMRALSAFAGTILRAVNEGIPPSRFEVAYLLIDGLNDTKKEIDALVALMDEMLPRVGVKLIRYQETGSLHPITGEPLRETPPRRVAAILSELRARLGANRVEFFEPDGGDVRAACGQLAGRRLQVRKRICVETQAVEVGIPAAPAAQPGGDYGYGN